MPRLVAALVVLVPLVVLAALPLPAAAVGEGEVQLAASGAWGWLERSGGGAALRLEGQYGLTQSLAVRGGAGAWVGPTQAAALDLGFTYSLDVLRVVPFGEAGVAMVGHGIGPQL